MRILIWILGSIGGLAACLFLTYWALLPPTVPVPERSDAVISGVRVLNPGKPLLSGQTIVVSGGRIVEIRPVRDGDPDPVCDGCFVMPGLIDAHVHTPPRIAVGNQELFALLFLAYGVTSVRDVGQSEDSIAALAKRLNTGALVGPHMYRCGPIIESPPTSWPLAKVVTTAEEGTAAVEELAADGVDCIKVYNELKPEPFHAITSAARAADLPVIGHVPHAILIDQLSDFESQHFTGVPYLTRPRPPHGTDFQDTDVQAMGKTEVERVFEIARQNNLSFTPTLANLSLRLIASDRTRFPPTDGARYLPEFWAGAWNLIAGHPDTEAAIQMRIATQPLIRALAATARDKGVDILAGTDTLMPWVVPGEAVHLEIAALAQAFGDNEAALEAATAVNGRHIDSGAIGVLQVGARADMLLLRNDPRQNLDALRQWEVLYTDGRSYKRADVDGWLQSYEQHFKGGFYSAVMGTAISWVVGDYAHVASDG